ncbi:MAG: S1-like domain-containing RNA-binding protein [Bacteroidales bacterium]|jgi:predicted RNA-binding protein (virulence factor B family)|nr:S1-like domain-containing RNA-binding protein [Bacteroidales bacterium]
MAEIGKLNKLEVVKEVSFGVFLDGGEHGEILMPKRYVPEDTVPGNILEVFVYMDSEDRIVATTEKPLAMVGDFAILKAVASNRYGAFLDWGLVKDLFVPHREQRMKIEQDNWYLVYIYLDNETSRIAASTKVDRFLDNLPPEYKEGDEVDIMICSKTDIGYKAIINSTHWGIIYNNQVFETLRRGDKRKAYINKVREDEKIDLLLHKPGYDKIDSFTQKVLDELEKSGGYLALNDKSPAEVIYKRLEMSKKNFKKAIGGLYKQKVITIGDDGIRKI